MSWLTPAANGLWLLSCLPGAMAFRRALRDVAGAQERLLLNLLRRNAETEYGRRYGFGAIRSAGQYREQVPLTTYDDYREAVAAIGAGHSGVLTADPVLLLELTSGSTAATKQIPYTAGLKAEFQRAIAPWIFNLYTRNPGLLAGQAYWSISPVAQRNQRTEGGIPIGFEDDAEYLGGFQRHLMQSLMAVPSLVRFITDMDAFRYTTLLFLLRSRSLALISVWNPTFLTLLMERLPEWGSRLAADIGNGTVTASGIEPDLRERLAALNPPDPRRAADVPKALSTGQPCAELWPNLRIISCWTDAAAAPYVADVARLFPQARIQGKGLIATEGFVTFPLAGRAGAVPAITSHYLEFLPPGGAPAVGVHELEEGETYSVVLTTGGGLYRYQLHDLVQVTGRLGACPLLRFVGKEAFVSDHFGEKLNERHVREALQAATAALGLNPAFAMLACEGKAYTLFVEDGSAPDGALVNLAARVETALTENFHYRYCRELGQLEAVRVYRIEPGTAAGAYLNACVARGQRAGDVKPVALHRLGGWTALFPGRPVPVDQKEGRP